MEESRNRSQERWMFQQCFATKIFEKIKSCSCWWLKQTNKTPQKTMKELEYRKSKRSVWKWSNVTPHLLMTIWMDAQHLSCRKWLLIPLNTKINLDQLEENRLKVCIRTSLAVQWFRLHLPMQAVWVQFLVRELTSHMSHGQKKKKKQTHKTNATL